VVLAIMNNFLPLVFDELGQSLPHQLADFERPHDSVPGFVVLLPDHG
jgi:hypothetical protein